MTDIEAKAKAMFFDYACRTYFMAHDGVHKVYEKYGISSAQEKEWRREYIAHWIEQLSIEDLTPVDRLRDAEAVEALPELLTWLTKGDDFAKLWYANAVWYLAQRALIPATLRDQATMNAVDVWRSLVDAPIKISNTHRAKVASIVKTGALNASTPEEYVLNYAKANLEVVYGTRSFT